MLYTSSLCNRMKRDYIILIKIFIEVETFKKRKEIKFKEIFDGEKRDEKFRVRVRKRKILHHAMSSIKGMSVMSCNNNVT